ncbi:MAG: hypothetical protein IJW26_05705, partial [Clostridia bacterium]|nr:hypothetical protein [Clostridia bacterium]
MKNKIRILLFSLFVLTFIIFVTNSNFNVFASSNQIEEINIEKTNAEISTDSIIVTLTVEETRKFKNYQASDFSNIGCIS